MELISIPFYTEILRENEEEYCASICKNGLNWYKEIQEVV